MEKLTIGKTMSLRGQTTICGVYGGLPNDAAVWVREKIPKKAWQVACPNLPVHCHSTLLLFMNFAPYRKKIPR